MSEIKAWHYYWRISKEEYEQRKATDNNDHCALNSMEWASLTLTQDGLFACVSDYGNYIHAWGAHCRTKGEDFRKFVSQIDGHYLLGKTRKRDEIHQEHSAEPLRLKVKELRECHNKHFKTPVNSYRYRLDPWCDHGSWKHLGHDKHTAEWAKQCLDSIDNLDKQNLNQLYYELGLYFDGEDIHYTYSSQALTFAKYVLPQLQRMIKEELAAELQQKDIETQKLEAHTVAVDEVFEKALAESNQQYAGAMKKLADT